MGKSEVGIPQAEVTTTVKLAPIIVGRLILFHASDEGGVIQTEVLLGDNYWGMTSILFGSCTIR